MASLLDDLDYVPVTCKICGEDDEIYVDNPDFDLFEYICEECKGAEDADD